MKPLAFQLSDAVLWVCDMRPGIAQDGVEVKLPAGRYRCEIVRDASAAVSAITYTREGAQVTVEERVGKVALDMARIGVVALNPLLARHGGDWEAMAEWSDEAAERAEQAWGGKLPLPRHHAAFFATGSDGQVEIFKLLAGRRAVGLALRPVVQPTKATAKPPQRWTQVELKWPGLGETWNWCDDWDCEVDARLDRELVLGEIESALSSLSEAPFNAGKPLADYSPKLRRVQWIKVSLEDEGDNRVVTRGRRKGLAEPVWRPITATLELPKLGDSLTARTLAGAVLDIFKQARKRHAQR